MGTEIHFIGGSRGGTTLIFDHDPLPTQLQLPKLQSIEDVQLPLEPDCTTTVELEMITELYSVHSIHDKEGLLTFAWPEGWTWRTAMAEMFTAYEALQFWNDTYDALNEVTA